MSVASASRLPLDRSRLSMNRRSFSTTPTRSNLSSAASIHRTYLHSPSSNHLFPSNLPLKKLRPEPWQRFFDGEKRQVSSRQGLTIRKNKQNVDAILNEEFFHLTDEQNSSDDPSLRSSLPPVIQAHIDHLCEQIDDLTLRLAEERLDHKQTRQRTEEYLQSQLQLQNKQFQELLHRTMLEHEKDLEELTSQHSRSLGEEQRATKKREEQLTSEIDFLKASFHSYKITLDEENEEKLHTRMEEAKEAMKKELEGKEEELNRKMNEAIFKERKNLAARQKNDIENIRKQHRKEIDTIHKTFAESAFDRAKVETLSKDLTETKLQLEEETERAVSLATKMKDLEIRHVEATRELTDFRTRFDGKVKEIENHYAGRMDQLHLQIIDLRKMYMKKCEELVDERTLTQKKLDEQVKLTKKQLQRKLLNVRIASVVPLTADIEPRRLVTRATAAQHKVSPTRCRSAFAASHSVSAVDEEVNADDQSPTDFTLHNTRRETKLRRRASAPITEEERDVVRYLASSSTATAQDSTSSKYNFESERTMLKNLSLEDLQETFKTS